MLLYSHLDHSNRKVFLIALIFPIIALSIVFPTKIESKIAKVKVETKSFLPQKRKGVISDNSVSYLVPELVYRTVDNDKTLIIKTDYYKNVYGMTVDKKVEYYSNDKLI